MLKCRISISINSTTMCCLCVSCCLPLSRPLTLVEREAAQLTATHTPPSAPALRPTQIPRQPTSHHQSGKYTNTYSPPLRTHAPSSLGPFLLSSPTPVWASCKISPILAKLLLLAYISSNSICTVCAKNTILERFHCKFDMQKASRHSRQSLGISQFSANGGPNFDVELCRCQERKAPGRRQQNRWGLCG